MDYSFDKMFLNKQKSWSGGECLVSNDSDMHIINVSKEFCQKFGYTEGECIGAKLGILINNENVKKIREYINGTEQNERTCLNCSFIKKSGTEIEIYIYAVEEQMRIRLYIVDTIKLVELQNNIFKLMSLFPGGYIVYSCQNSEDAINDDAYELDFANELFYETIGHTPEQFAEKNNKLFSIVDPKTIHDPTMAYKKAMLVPGYTFKTDHNFISNNGEIIPVSAALTSLIIDNRRYIICSFLDISQQIAMRERLTYLTERNKILTESADEIIFEYDIINDKFSVPDKYVDTFNVNPFRVSLYSGQLIKKLVYQDDIRRCRDKVKIASKKELRGNSEIRLYDKNGELCWYKISYATMADSEGKIYRLVGRLNNINDIKVKEQEIVKRLLLDSMTGLYNKTSIKVKAEEYFREDKRSRDKMHAVLVIDIDDFKRINDTLGHMFGDIVIESVASAIKSNIREYDLAGRVGGDEFVVILKDIDEQIAVNKAEKIGESVSKIYSGYNKGIRISTSIGIAFYGVHGIDYETLFTKADSAMYYSKKNGKSEVTIFDSRKHNIIGTITKPRVNTKDIDTTTDYDKQFIQYTYSMLLNSKDYNATISILLEKVGKKYNFDRVSINVVNEDEEILYEINRWEANRGIVNNDLEIRNYKGWADHVKFLLDKNVNIIKDCYDDTVFSKEDQMVFRSMNIKSFMNCRISRSDLKTDYLFAFFNNTEVTDKTDYDKETLYQFCLTMAFFLSFRTASFEKSNQLEKLYIFDRLTGVYNFDSFMVKGRSLIKHFDQKKYQVLMYSDIMGFSHFNDNMGYESGDDILIGYSSILRGESNVKMVCRLHSDLFINIIEGYSKEDVINTVEKLRTKFSGFLKNQYPMGDCRLNVGLFHINNNRVELAYAIDCANLARKVAKNKPNSSYIFYSDDMRWDRNNEQDIVSSLSRAIETRDIILFLQPKVDLRDGSLIGAESLVRWKSPDGGYILPDCFVPALERMGNIIELDFYIFEESLKLIKKWKNEGKPNIRISVNFSRRHNSNQDFVDRVVLLTKKYDLKPEDIEIEVTESCLADDTQIMNNNLSKLHKLGYHIAMDDFGTGYSSLDILLTSPLDVVKIDKSFLRKLDEGQLSKEYIIKICELIRITNKDIIFEGVESKEHVDFLLENKIYSGQGYYFNKAISVERFEELYF